MIKRRVSSVVADFKIRELERTIEQHRYDIHLIVERLEDQENKIQMLEDKIRRMV